MHAERDVRKGSTKQEPSPENPSGDGSAASGGEPDASLLVLVDASNVAHAGEGGTARLANLLVIRDKLVGEGMQPVFVADAALRHQIDDGAGYEELVERGDVRQAPAGTDADYFILTFARELGASVLSNDRFKDRIAQYADVRERIIRYMILEGEAVLERRAHRRTG